MRKLSTLFVNATGLLMGAAVFALAAASCGPTKTTCGPATCQSGCCSADGECMPETAASCGPIGGACVACASGQSCLNTVCVNGGTGGGSGGGSAGGEGGGAAPMPKCTMPTAVTCQDEQIMKLLLKDNVNPDPITEEGTGEPYKTLILTSAGGLMPTSSYVYGAFQQTGLKKVEISDEQAFTSMDWDIAIRRYVVRINAGVGGPSCTRVGRTAAGTNFDTLTVTPNDLTWRTEEYYTDTCEFVADTSGIGAPGTAMSSFWSYMSCVEMTGNIYVLQLRDGRYVKLRFDSYYTPTVQEYCNMEHKLPGGDSGAGNVRITWDFIAPPVP